MKYARFLSTMLMVFLIASCQQDDSELPQINQETRRIVSAEDIPEVTSTMLQKMGLGRGDKAFSVNQGNQESQLKVNWDQIKQLIDSTGHQTYAFGIEDYDEDPYTFYNLVFKINEYEEANEPYLLRYAMDETFIPEFQATGSLLNFKGTITKVLLKDLGNKSGRAVYDDDGEEILLGDDCPNTTTFTGNSTGNNTTGGGFVSGSHGTTGDRCVTQLVATDWYSQACSRSTGECEPWKYMETTYEYVTRCGDGLSTTSERIDDTGCESDDGTIPIIVPDLERRKKLDLLSSLLKQDSTKLINLPCSEMEKWQEVGGFKPPNLVTQKMERIKDNGSWLLGNFNIQTLENASGTVVNMDYFPVNVTRLPNGYTPESFLSYIRLNFNSFIDTEYSEFEPYDAVSTGVDETALWNSNDPTGAIIHIEIPGDEGSVICSDVNSNNWKFTTIRAPWDWSHPVSGTREFGFKDNEDGSYTFYTRGVDRITQSFNETIGERRTFNGADNLWKSFQEKIARFVNSNGGNGFQVDPTMKRLRPSSLVRKV